MGKGFLKRQIQFLTEFLFASWESVPQLSNQTNQTKENMQADQPTKPKTSNQLQTLRKKPKNKYTSLTNRKTFPNIQTSMKTTRQRTHQRSTVLKNMAYQGKSLVRGSIFPFSNIFFLFRGGGGGWYFLSAGARGEWIFATKWIKNTVFYSVFWPPRCWELGKNTLFEHVCCGLKRSGLKKQQKILCFTQVSCGFWGRREE